MLKKQTVIRKPRFSRKKTVLAVLLVIVVLLAVLELTNVTNLIGSPKVDEDSGASTGQATKGEPKNEEQPAANPATSAGSNDKSQSSADQSAPSGQAPKSPSESSFINNHSPHMGDAMESTCVTTPGAKCKIIFTNGSVTKSLPTKTADSEGVVYWAWNVNDYLSVGTWQVKAQATLNGQTKTASDAIPVRVRA